MALLAGVHEHKGKQELYIEAHADALTTLMEIAKVQSTEDGYLVKIGGGRSVAYGKTDK